MARIALMQCAAPNGDMEAAFALLADGARRAAAEGAQILLTPELFLTGYGIDNARALAQPSDGPAHARVAALARQHDLAIAYGAPLLEGDFVSNAALFVTPDGQTRIYRKCHLYGRFEKDQFASGAEIPPVFAYAGLKIGLLICYDVEFPETVRQLVADGADLVLVPTALPMSDAEVVALRMVPTRAAESGIALAYADFRGTEGRFTYAGLSVIVGPDGKELARAPSDADAFLVADIDRAMIDEARRNPGYLRDLRHDLYGD